MPLAGRFLSWRSTLFWDFSKKNPKKVSISKRKMLLQRAKVIYIVYFRELLNDTGLNLKGYLPMSSESMRSCMLLHEFMGLVKAL